MSISEFPMTLCVPAAGAVAAHPVATDKYMYIVCGRFEFRMDRQALKDDFAHFDQLFQENNFHAFPDQLLLGWQVIFSSPLATLDEDSEVLKQLRECVRISGSKFWGQVLTLLDNTRTDRLMRALSMNEQPLPLVGLSTLKLQSPLLPDIVRRVVLGTRSFEVIDLQVYENAPVELSWFDACPRLRELHLRHVVSKEFNWNKGLVGFSDAQRLAQLVSVTIRSALLQKGVVASLCALPVLQRLALVNSTLETTENLAPLKTCNKLTHVTLEALKFKGCRPENLLQGYLHLLRKELPQTEVRPIVDLPDYTDFSQVLTTLVTPTSFGPDDAETVTNDVLAKLLDTNQQHTYWPKDIIKSEELNRFYDFESFVSYDHNRIKLPFAFSGSPIKGLDERGRFALPEPRGTNVSNFWAAVLELKVSLVVMVKELDRDSLYFPLNENEKKVFKSPTGEQIEVICTSVRKLDYDMTLRTFLVNGREVKHLHKQLRDGSGMDLDALLAFLKLIEEIEGQTPDFATIVHCLQGVGRTGMTLACLILIQLMRKWPKGVPVRLDLEKLLSGLRQQRENMVLTEIQLRTLLRLFKKLYYST
jgi:protein tyrosine phosphatase